MGISIITNSISMGILSLSEVLDQISLWFDDVIYSGVAGLYTIFMAFAKLNFRDAFPALETFKNNVFLILGVFMLFAVAFSLLKYLLDPDKASDKSGGAAGIVKNIFISLVLVIVVQPAFDMLYDAQTAIIDNQVMNKLILGSGDNSGINDSKSLGESFAYTAWISFFTQSNGYMCSGDNTMCANIAKDVATGVVGDMTADETVQHIKDDNITYHKLFSCIGGIFIFVMLITFIIDVGIRAFKLMFYEAIAPIAIFSYIVPSTQKNFFNWAKAVGSTFADLFIRIAAILFAIILISNVGNAFAEDAMKELSGISAVLAYFFLIIAILTFAKMVPKLLGDLFGISLGDSSLNPFKNTFFGAGLGGMLGAGIGSIGGTVTGAATGGIGGAIGGAFLGAGKGAFGGLKGKSPMGGIKAGTGAATGIRDKNKAIAAAGGRKAFYGNKLREMVGSGSTVSGKLSKFKGVTSGNGNIKDYINEKANKKLSVNSKAEYAKLMRQEAMNTYDKIKNAGELPEWKDSAGMPVKLRDGTPATMGVEEYMDYKEQEALATYDKVGMQEFREDDKSEHLVTQFYSNLKDADMDTTYTFGEGKDSKTVEISDMIYAKDKETGNYIYNDDDVNDALKSKKSAAEKEIWSLEETELGRNNKE